MTRIPRLLAASALALTLAACSDSSHRTAVDESRKMCTLIGCGDILVVTLDGLLTSTAPSLPLTFSVCLDDRPCELFWVGASPEGPVCTVQNPDSELIYGCSTFNNKLRLNLLVGEDDAFDGAQPSVRLTAQMQDGSQVFTGEEKGSLTSRQPNGPGCEPICHQGGVTFVWPGTTTDGQGSEGAAAGSET
jgi:hypothetical protein